MILPNNLLLVFSSYQHDIDAYPNTKPEVTFVDFSLRSRREGRAH